MKSMMFAIVLLFSSLSFAAVEFRTDSQVPADLQAQISQTVAQTCVETTENNWSVMEVSTEVFVDRVDNGLTDTYFTTTFEVYAKELDSNHSRRYPMTVRTIFTEANNGLHTGVEILEGCR